MTTKKNGDKNDGVLYRDDGDDGVFKFMAKKYFTKSKILQTLIENGHNNDEFI